MIFSPTRPGKNALPALKPRQCRFKLETMPSTTGFAFLFRRPPLLRRRQTQVENPFIPANPEAGQAARNGHKKKRDSRPVFISAFSTKLLQRAADNVEQLRGYRLLAHLVILQLQIIQQFAGVVVRHLHGKDTSRLLGGLVLQQSPDHRGVNRQRIQRVQNRPRIRLINEIL